MLIEWGEIQLFTYVKNINTLLYNQTRHNESRHYCLMCLMGFSKREILAEHEKHCEGIEGKPTRIQMPNEDNKDLYFKNYQNQQKVPYVIYADFEPLYTKNRRTRTATRRARKLHRKEKHTCSMWLRLLSSKKRWNGDEHKYYRGENTVEEFLKEILNEEANIRNSLED